MRLHLKKSNLEAYWLLTRMHKPIGSLLLLWPMYWALWIASDGQPDLLVFIVFTLGVVFMRSAGCVINDYADRHIDPHVSRTKDRPIAKPLSALLGLKQSAYPLCATRVGLSADRHNH